MTSAKVRIFCETTKHFCDFNTTLTYLLNYLKQRKIIAETFGGLGFFSYLCSVRLRQRAKVKL